jgi:hypothetical protein
MTFEDFFIKKRIDLLQLQEAEPSLYKEFKRHFELMGEKSFDHTKKFWFNRLRKSFHLKEEVSISKPLPGQSSTEEQKTIAVEEVSQVTKPTGFKPRFKAAKPQESDGDKASEKEEKSSDERTVVPESTSQKPVGFKPRFKPGKSSSAETESSSGKEVGQEDTSNKAKNPTDEPTAVNKPSGFKPRFKAGVTKGTDTQSINQPSPSEQAQLPSEKTDQNNNVTAPSLEETKPLGFKPRFKAGITNKKTSDEEKIEEEDLQKKSETVTPSKENTTSAEEKEAQTPQKPMGFKPRFKAGVTKKVTPDEEDTSAISSKEATIEIKTTEEQSALQDEIKPTTEDQTNTSTSNTPPSSTKAPLGFKPRFKPKKKEE